ncbi:MAG: hypothetical protein FH748_13445 [Balneolaceae bacterium]|nr:hypothetical protein [Balneolaceae bacterium]
MNELSKESLIEINGGAIPPWVVRYGPTAAAIAWERAVELYNDWDAIVEAFWEGWEAGKAAME